MANEENNLPIRPMKFSANDSAEVNDLINISDGDISIDLLAQLESKALEVQKQLEDDDPSEISLLTDNNIDNNELVQQDIDLQQGFTSSDGSVSLTGEITERPIAQNAANLPQKVNREAMDLLEEAKMNAAYKKYVIYIDRDNESFIDSLSLKERKEVINQVLAYQNNYTKEQRKEREKIEKTIKSMIAIATFLIAIPVFYFLFNVCLEATIQNYKHSKSNFEVLYKETGKIKPVK